MSVFTFLKLYKGLKLLFTILVNNFKKQTRIPCIDIIFYNKSIYSYCPVAIMKKFSTTGNISWHSSSSGNMMALSGNIGDREKLKRNYTSLFINHLHIVFLEATQPMQNGVVSLQ